MKKIACLREGPTTDHNTDMSKSGSRGRWHTMAKGSVAFVTTLLVGMMLLLLSPAGVRAASFTVDTFEDVSGPNYYCTNPDYWKQVTGKNSCSLRIAITASNGNKQSNNIIYLKQGTYKLTGALPTITNAMLIHGEKSTMSFNQNYHHRIFKVAKPTVAAPNPKLQLHNITIHGGYTRSQGRWRYPQRRLFSVD